jgi:hypothetical protein
MRQEPFEMSPIGGSIEVGGDKSVNRLRQKPFEESPTRVSLEIGGDRSVYQFTLVEPAR